MKKHENDSFRDRTRGQALKLILSLVSLNIGKSGNTLCLRIHFCKQWRFLKSRMFGKSRIISTLRSICFNRKLSSFWRQLSRLLLSFKVARRLRRVCHAASAASLRYASTAAGRKQLLAHFRYLFTWGKVTQFGYDTLYLLECAYETADAI